MTAILAAASDSASSEAALAIFVTVMVVVYGLTLLLVIATWVVMAFALMALFRKVGVKPWVAWVPYYRTWVWLQLGGQPGWIALAPLVGLGIATTVFLIIAIQRISVAFRRDTGFVVLGVFLPFAWAFILGGRDSVYEPGLLAWRGYPPPLVGYGSVVPNAATEPFAAPTTPSAPGPGAF
ncbi:DUF5684 domain-containing protein [Herbiconiux solani]|uniref:DUF5684 domain-containing protein n=1 Tax=Herbiconiux solani TaxID=661329 RepID=UPI0008240DD7|nr:DUF5684 domain-containing protein [Herbiconiux solani]